MDRQKLKEINIQKAKDELIGVKVGNLTVESYLRTEKKEGHIFLCKCSCGNIAERNASCIRRSIKHERNCSCGCISTGGRPTIHGGTNTRLYVIWDGIKERCRDKNNKRYGGRNITMCDDWMSDFTIFKAWALENGYSDELSIDRIDNDGNYCPENCRWTTAKEQMNNRSVSVKYLYNGELKNADELGSASGITGTAFRKRLAKGMTVEEATETPKNYSYDRYCKG